MAEKVTIMILILKVDLQCPKCYKKVKKLLCKFPQIRDQKYDDKANKVIITVVCCSPEKIRDKLCCKGCGLIKSIEIVEPPPPKVEQPKPKEVPPPPPKEELKPTKVVIVEPPKKEDPPHKPKEDPPKPKEDPPKPKEDPPKPKPKEEPPKMPPPVTGYPPVFPVIGVCLLPYCEGYGGWGRCPHGSGGPAGPGFDGCSCGSGGVRRGPGNDGCECGCGGSRWQASTAPCNDGCECGCGGRGVYENRSDQYFCEENPQSCTIM